MVALQAWRDRDSFADSALFGRLLDIMLDWRLVLITAECLCVYEL
jgi:hypothetical protein